MDYESAMTADTTQFPKTGDIPYVMQFTRDPQLIAGYKKLRQELYGIDPRFVGFRIFNDTGAENYEDEDDQMLILHYQGRVYGGACLRVSTPQRPVILDLETDILPPSGKFYFSLQEHLPELELNQYAYAEFNRIVLSPALRRGEATRNMFQAILDRCLDYRVRYMFGIGDKVRTRLYTQIYQAFGLKGHWPEIDIPMREDYEGLKMHLIYGDMKCFFTTKQDPEGLEALKLPRNDFAFTDQLPAA